MADTAVDYAAIADKYGALDNAAEQDIAPLAEKHGAKPALTAEEYEAIANKHGAADAAEEGIDALATKHGATLKKAVDVDAIAKKYGAVDQVDQAPDGRNLDALLAKYGAVPAVVPGTEKTGLPGPPQAPLAPGLSGPPADQRPLTQRLTTMPRVAEIWDAAKHTLGTPFEQQLSDALGKYGPGHVATIQEHYDNLRRALADSSLGKSLIEPFRDVPGVDALLKLTGAAGRGVAGALDFGRTPLAAASMLAAPAAVGLTEAAPALVPLAGTRALIQTAEPQIAAAGRLVGPAIRSIYTGAQTPEAMEAIGKARQNPTAENVSEAAVKSLMAAAPVAPEIGKLGPELTARLDAHNAEAARLVREDRAAGETFDQVLPRDITRAKSFDPIKVWVGDSQFTVREVGQTANSRRPIYEVSDAYGEVLRGGTGTAETTENFLRSHGATPYAPPETPAEETTLDPAALRPLVKSGIITRSEADQILNSRADLSPDEIARIHEAAKLQEATSPRYPEAAPTKKAPLDLAEEAWWRKLTHADEPPIATEPKAAAERVDVPERPDVLVRPVPRAEGVRESAVEDSVRALDHELKSSYDKFQEAFDKAQELNKKGTAPPGSEQRQKQLEADSRAFDADKEWQRAKAAAFDRHGERLQKIQADYEDAIGPEAVEELKKYEAALAKARAPRPKEPEPTTGSRPGARTEVPNPPSARKMAARPEIPETGVPEDVARAHDAREQLAQRIFKTPFSSLGDSDRHGIDSLVAEGYGFAAQPEEPKASHGPETEDIITGRHDLPLTKEGKSDADEVAPRVANIKQINAGPMARTEATAEAIAQHAGKGVEVTEKKAFGPWSLGDLEGRRQGEVAEQVNDYAINKPDTRVPGGGTSYNEYKAPLIGAVQTQVKEWKPGDRVLNVTHSIGVHTVLAWAKNGAPDDKSISADAFKNREKIGPTSLWRLDPRTMIMSQAEDSKQDGIYFLRHANTAWDDVSGADEAGMAKPPSVATAPNGVQSQATKVQHNVRREETLKPEVAATLAEGSTRVTPNGGVETLKSVPLDKVHAISKRPGWITESAWAARGGTNTIYPETVQRYAAHPSPVAPELREGPNGSFVIWDGHHRVEAARVRGEKSMLAWTSEPNEEGYPKVSTEVQDRLADELGIKRATGLPEDAQKVADNARRELASDPEGFIARYRDEFGNVFNADDAAELFPEYRASNDSRSKYHTAVHNAARWVRDAAFKKALEDPDSPKSVVFTSGGSASGKSTAIEGISPASAIVYDSTLSNPAGSEAVVQEALNAKKDIIIAHVRRDLDESFIANLARGMNDYTGKGRTTSIRSMVRTHEGADQTIHALAEKYGNDPRVTIDVFELIKGRAEPRAIDALPQRDYTDADERLHGILERERPNLTEGVYRAAKGLRGADRKDDAAVVGTVREQPRTAGQGTPETRPEDRQVVPAEAEVGHSSTQLNLPAEIASAIQKFADSIPTPKLGERGIERTPHITVKGGLHGDDPGEVAALLKGEKPIEVKLGRLSVFSNDDADVLKIDVESDSLNHLNAKLTAALPNTDEHPDYKPHITVAYLKPGEGKTYNGRPVLGVTGKRLQLPTLTFSPKTGETTDLDLSGASKAAAKIVAPRGNDHSIKGLPTFVTVKDGTVESISKAEGKPMFTVSFPLSQWPTEENAHRLTGNINYQRSQFIKAKLQDAGLDYDEPLIDIPGQEMGATPDRIIDSHISAIKATLARAQPFDPQRDFFGRFPSRDKWGRPLPTENNFTYFTGANNEGVATSAKTRTDIGLMISPDFGHYLDQIKHYPVVTIDNGAFYKTPTAPPIFERFIDRVAEHPEAKNKVFFVVAPDKVGDPVETLRRFKEWEPKIHGRGLPVAFVLQDGIENMLDQIPWDKIDVLFVGGSTEWKLGDFKIINPGSTIAVPDEMKMGRWRELFREAERQKKPIHMGRVNSYERAEIASYGLGFGSADGTYLAFGPTKNLPKLEQWLARLNAKDDALVRQSTPAPQPAEHWLKSLSDDRRESVFVEMRKLNDEATRLYAENQKLSPGYGEIAVGGAHMDPLFKAEAIRGFLGALNAGKTVDEAIVAGNKEADYAISNWNEKRRDYVTARALGSEDAMLQDYGRRIRTAAAEPEPKPKPSPVPTGDYSNFENLARAEDWTRQSRPTFNSMAQRTFNVATPDEQQIAAVKEFWKQYTAEPQAPPKEKPAEAPLEGRDAEIQSAQNYVDAIKNPEKRMYAKQYMRHLLGERDEPELPGKAWLDLSTMAAQAVRMRLRELMGEPTAAPNEPSGRIEAPEEPNETPETRPGGREGSLEGVLPEDVQGAPEERPSGGGGARGGGVDEGSVREPSGAGTVAGSGPGGDVGTVGVPTGGTRGPTNPRQRRTATGTDYRITAADHLGEGSAKTKAAGNLDAIRTLKAIESEGREATPDEQKTLAKYVGWGMIPQPFMQSWEVPRDWAGVRADLDSLLTPEEFESASASTPNAHFTSQMVVDAMWNAAKRLGLLTEGGQVSVLEPAMGTGNFFGLMPEGTEAQRVGIELDSITGRIATLLYPNADIHVAGFEAVRLPGDYFDLAIGNVPFGNYPVHDPAYKREPGVTRSIHDYFFAKAMGKIRPGGVVAFITSSYTMDKQDPFIREYLAERANLLGAIRLPNTAFKASAGTEVTTDIIILQKRGPNTPASGETWTDLAPHTGERERPDGSIGPAEMQVNEYYARHPEMMLGKMGLFGTMRRAEEPALTGDLTPEKLAAAVARLPENVVTEWEAPAQTFDSISAIPEVGEVKDGAYTIKDGQLLVRRGDQLRPVDMKGEQATLVRGMVSIRNAMHDVLRTQREGATDAEVKIAMGKLNAAYDSFVRAHGPLHAKDNYKAFGDDPDSPTILALEKWDAETKKAEKAEMFSKRVIDTIKPAESAENAKDALGLSLNEKGRIDWTRMQELTGKTPDELREELGPLVFQNPAGKAWEPADEYLSGNVRDKLLEAEAAARTDKSFQANVDALKAVQPKDLIPGEITARLGSSWIPTGDIRDFIAQLLDMNPRTVDVGHSEQLALWSLKVRNADTVANQRTWGTNRFNGNDLIEDALNMRFPTAYDTVTVAGNRTQVINEPETLAAREMQKQIKDRFAEWVWQDPDRAERLTRTYNDEHNNWRLWQPDGSHLTFPGMAVGLKLRPHQKNGVWRIVRGDGNVLLAHVVGSGKTLEIVAGAMELRRLGRARKPLVTVPKNRVQGTATEWLRAYPSANILVIGGEDFGPAERQQMMARIATGNWDGVIVSYESFAALPVSDETFNAFLQKQIKELESYIREAKAEAGGKANARIVKDLEKSKKRLTAKLRTKQEGIKRDRGITFEDLGIDALFVDEADSFKNLQFPTKMARVAGIPNTESKRAFDMYIKTQYIAKRNGGRGIVFATGTPVANSMAEVWTMQRYLQPKYLRDHGLQHFDAWAQTFGQVTPTIEMKPDGSGVRVTNKFNKFVNAPELMKGFRQMADVQTAKMLKLPVPQLKTGKPIIVSAKASPVQLEHLKSLAERAKRVKGKKPTKGADNILVIGTDGQKGSLDMRLIDPSLPDHPGSKVNMAIDNIVRVWKESAKDKGTQLVFSDLGVPNKKSRGFNLYADIKQKLVARGIPANEIAFMQNFKDDDAKEELFAAVNRGRVRVLLGSTGAMGVGVNVQKKLIAEHHLDAPYRPRDVEQREGRMIRQGNDNPEVYNYRYVTEPSLDARKWDILQGKAGFIDPFMEGNMTIREIEDISDAELSYGEIAAIASGNPAIREKVVVDTEIRKLDAMRSRHQQQQYMAQHDLESIPRDIAAHKATIAKAEQDIETRESNKPIFTIGKKAFEGENARKEAAAALGKILADRYAAKAYPPGEHDSFIIGIYRGFKLIGQDWSNTAGERRDPANIVAHGALAHNSVNHYSANAPESMGMSLVQSVEANIRNIESVVDENSKQIEHLQKKLADTKAMIGGKFDKEEELKQLIERQKELERILQTEPSGTGAETFGGDEEEGEETEAPEASEGTAGGGAEQTGETTTEESYRPISEYKTPQVRQAWNGSVITEGDLITDGHIAFRKDAVPKDKLQALLKPAKEMRELSASAAANFFDKTVANSTNPLTEIGWRTIEKPNGSFQRAFYADLTGKVHTFDPKLVKFVQSLTAADEIRGSDPDKPAVFYVAGKPVAMLAAFPTPDKADYPTREQIEAALGREADEEADEEADHAERGAISPGLLTLGLNRFVEEDVVPNVKDAAATLLEAIDDAQKIILPTARGRSSKQAGLIMRNRLAELARKSDQAESALAKTWKMFEKGGEKAGRDFILAYFADENAPLPQTGNKDLDAIAKVMRDLLDQHRTEVQNLGTGKLRGYYTNYFPRIWKDWKKAERVFASFFGRRPLEGSKSFLKKRKYPTIQDALNAGLEPISWNPVDLILMKIREMDRYVMAHQVLNDWKQAGLVRFVDARTGKAPTGWRKIDDPIGTIYGPSVQHITEFPNEGLYVALQKTAAALGLKHERGFANLRGAVGRASRSGRIQTMHGSAEDVLAHEIGHQIDWLAGSGNRFMKYGTPAVAAQIKQARETLANKASLPADRAAARATLKSLKDAIQQQVVFTRELRALADLRAGAKSYTHKREEKMALLSEMWVGARELFEATAPAVFKEWKKFLNDNPKLHALRDIRGNTEVIPIAQPYDVGGLVIKGNWYSPEGAARIMNNYLTPGLRAKSGMYRAALGLNNVMNQAQLGLSAFHLGFTSTDAMISRAALGFEGLFRGDVAAAGKAFIGVPLAPVMNFINGNKLLKEWHNPGSQGAVIQKIVEGLVSSGGRVKMDETYQTGIGRQMMRAFRKHNVWGGLIRSPFAAVEFFSNLIMKELVPRQKLGVFYDLAQFEMERLGPGATFEEVREALAKVWDSVENRMGQMTYDNLFWDRTAKDIAMITVRSVGWNLGTIREVGGGITDLVKIPIQIAGGKPPKDVDIHKISYLLALATVTAIMGAIYQYIATGKGPEELKDLYFPKTGQLDEAGRPQRESPPSYVKDIYHYWTEPGKTIANKVAPVWVAFSEMVRNRDFYGNKIRNEDDPLIRQLKDELMHVASSMTPFGVRNLMRERQLGAPIGQQVQQFFGMTQAPSALEKSKAELLASDLEAGRIPSGARTHEQALRHDAERNIARMAAQHRDYSQLARDYASAGILNSKEIRNAAVRSSQPPLVRTFRAMSVGDALRVWEVATPAERVELRGILAKKLQLVRELPPAERIVLIPKIQRALQQR